MIEKKRCKRLMSVLAILIAAGIVALSVSAQTPQPRNIEGRVVSNNSGGYGVPNGMPVRINSTTSADSVLVYTDGVEDIPELRGIYSTTILATNNEEIIGFSWNMTHYGTNRTTIQGGTTSLNFVLNISRPSEANVTILFPPNDTLMNKSVVFNITANISILGSDGTDCNATIRFSPASTFNITERENLTHALGSIPLGGHKVTNWSVIGLKEGSANATVSAACSSDGIKLDRVSSYTLSNVTFQNLGPQITRVIVDNPIHLTVGVNTSVDCNATVFEPNTVNDIRIVNATLFQLEAGSNSDDDLNYHYTNYSCANSSSAGLESNYTCRFNVAYFANNGTWRCNVTVSDYSNYTNISNTTFAIPELVGIEVLPNVIDFGALRATNISGDVNLTIRNIGNIPINATVLGFAPNESLGYLNLSMTCPIGNITNNYTRYSVYNGTPYDSMIALNNISAMINFTLWQRTNDNQHGNDSNSTFWKIKIPTLTLGACNGTVLFGARASY